MSGLSVPLWRRLQRENFIRIAPLLDFLEISEDLRPQIWEDPRFSLNLPRRLASKIEKNNLQDPIFLQYVPLQEEQKVFPGFVLHPVQDQEFCKTAKMLQKYKGRALLVTTSACAMHCRFCFRQNFPYETNVIGFEKEIRALEEDVSLEEVILSGGDPLSLSDASLSALLEAIDRIPHIKRIRFHTKFPLGIPERIDDGFIHMLSKISKQIFFVIHCNHPRELDEDVLFHLRKIRMLGIPILNQSVLLKGVNDDPEVLLDLCRSLINDGMIPYYLHQLDLVQGASHFQVSEDKALSLVLFLQKNLSGFAIPRLVREQPGQLSKTFIY
jgi:EF-P beta-lysylation protein EpmB